MADEGARFAVVPGEVGEQVGEIRQAGEAAFGDAVPGLVVGDYLIARGQQRKDESAHLRGVAAPAVREDHRGRVARAPAPRRDVAALVLEQRRARLDQIERPGRAAVSWRREEQALGPGAGELGEEQRRGSKANVRANSGQ